jgi:hypothetical protein
VIDSSSRYAPILLIVAAACRGHGIAPVEDSRAVDSHAVAQRGNHVADASVDAAPPVPVPPVDPRTILVARQSPVWIAVDETDVYYTDTGNTGSILRVSKHGGVPVALATDDRIAFSTGIAVDATDVFWASEGVPEPGRQGWRRRGQARGGRSPGPCHSIRPPTLVKLQGSAELHLVVRCPSGIRTRGRQLATATSELADP